MDFDVVIIGAGVIGGMLARNLSRYELRVCLLEKGNAISFLPDFVTDRQVREGKLARLDVKDFRTDIWKQMIYHRGKWISRPLRALIDFLSEHEFKA